MEISNYLKTKSIIISILILAVIAGFLIYSSQKPKPLTIPKAYILESKTLPVNTGHSSEALPPAGQELQFTTQKPKIELIDFYRNQLTKDGWQIVGEFGDKASINSSYVIVTLKAKNQERLIITISPQNNSMTIVNLSLKKEISDFSSDQ